MHPLSVQERLVALDVASPQPRERWSRVADGVVNTGFVVTVVVGWRIEIVVVTDADDVVVGIDAPGCVDSTRIPTRTRVASTPSNFARRVQCVGWGGEWSVITASHSRCDSSRPRRRRRKELA